jgi:hypothetical protein
VHDVGSLDALFWWIVERDEVDRPVYLTWIKR